MTTDGGLDRWGPDGPIVWHSENAGLDYWHTDGIWSDYITAEGRPTKTYPSDILLQKVGIENSAPNDILIANKNKAISWSGGVVVRHEFPCAILEADIFTLKTRAIGYGMIYHMKISDIEKSYYNSIGISKRAIKLKARKPPYERKIVESSVVSIGVRDVDDELEKQSREYPEDVEPEREKSKVSIEDYNDLL